MGNALFLAYGWRHWRHHRQSTALRQALRQLPRKRVGFSARDIANHRHDRPVGDIVLRVDRHQVFTRNGANRFHGWAGAIGMRAVQQTPERLAGNRFRLGQLLLDRRNRACLVALEKRRRKSRVSQNSCQKKGSFVALVTTGQSTQRQASSVIACAATL